jgi:alpha-glucosidase
MRRKTVTLVRWSLFFPLLIFLSLLLAAALSRQANAAPAQTSRFGPYFLTQQRLGNGLWHFRISLTEPEAQNPWASSPMLDSPANWAGPHPGPESRLVLSGVDTATPRLTIYETLPDNTQSVIFQIDPSAPDGQLAGLTFFGDRYNFIGGLGADFRFSLRSINYLGEIVMPGGPFGSIIQTSPVVRATGVQSPVCFALGSGFQNAALLINETRPLSWDFSSKPWYVGPIGPLGPTDSIEFFVILGQDLPALRRILMSLLGKPDLPPKSVFAPWIIVKNKPASVTYEQVLTDLSAFKGGFETLTFMFTPQPDNQPLAQAVADSLGLEILVTESPYLPIESPHFADLVKRGFLVRDGGPQAPPLILPYEKKQTAMIDYSHFPAANYWHSLVRGPQVEAGASLFHLVGGEPEVYSPTAWYQGEPDENLHSQYTWGSRFALKWIESFKSSLAQRPSFGRPSLPRLFTVSRAGMAGMGRFGAGVLTIDPNPFDPRNAGQARANLILSGIDYYSTDVSPLLEGDTSFSLDSSTRLYEAWLANVVLLNLPLVMPSELVNFTWTRKNLDLKASLEPYYYSLAYKSIKTGDPVIAPLLYYFQDDPLARDSTFVTMVGPSLLVPAGIRANYENLDFHLPKGRWYNPYNHDIINQEAGATRKLPIKFQGLHMPPILYRSGSVIPMISDPSGPNRGHSILAFPGESPASFDWYEDNGYDQSYLSNGYTITALELTPIIEGSPVTLTIRAKQGSVPNGETDRSFWIEFVGIGNVGSALLDGEILRRLNSEELLRTMNSGWFSTGSGRLLFKTPPLNTNLDHQIVLN